VRIAIQIAMFAALVVAFSASTPGSASAHYCRQANIASVDANCQPTIGGYTCIVWVGVVNGVVHRCVSGGAPLNNPPGVNDTQCDSWSDVAVDTGCPDFYTGDYCVLYVAAASVVECLPGSAVPRSSRSDR
jgi:hypothetical protein